jgi:hypothetical protein
MLDPIDGEQDPMTDIMTIASLPKEAGLMDYGRLSRAEIIRRTREMAAHQKERAERILAASDEEFDVRVVRGKHARKLIERLPPAVAITSPEGK